MRLVKGLLERCTEVMRELASRGAVGVTELASDLDLPKTAAHRLLQELCRLGWVQQEADGRYAAALRFALLGNRVLQDAGMVDEAQPLLDRLARESRELVRLTIATGDGLAWLGMAQGASNGLVYQPEMTDPVVLHATANGKALLATYDDEGALSAARRSGLGRVARTAHTITDEAVLLADLARIRARGYALAEGEAEDGVTAVAVAIRPDGGLASGTVSVAGPSVRLPPARVPALAEGLAATAAVLASLRLFKTPQEALCASK